jgi:dihydroorotate dehydrogenase/Pyruvate/2-oxoacid:ferredoxin oxidoreductase delta subunit
MADLAVRLNGIDFANPVLPAAGPNVRDARMMLSALEGGAGAVVSKTFSVQAAIDPRPNIMAASNRGCINCETWSEIPMESFLEELRQVKRDMPPSVPLVVSIGYSPEEVREIGKRLEDEIKPDAIEFSTHYTGSSLKPLLDVAESLRNTVSCPIWMKLSPNFPDLEELARSAAPLVHAFVAINSYGPVLDFDVEDPRPLLGSDSGEGWLSGPPIRPMALRIVRRLTAIQNNPVIGVGGVERGVDAIKFFMAGASLVQVCSAAIKNGHTAYGTIASELADWLESHGYDSPEEVRGLFGRNLREKAGRQSRFGSSAVMSVDAERCTGCKACISRCVHGALEMTSSDLAAVLNERCIGCGFCRSYCRFGALELREG